MGTISHRTSEVRVKEEYVACLMSNPRFGINKSSRAKTVAARAFFL
jgi:hypothetical protein